MPALTFLHDNAAVLAIGIVIVSVLLFAEWRRFRADQRSLNRIHRRLFLADEVRHALHPEAHPGPTHQHPSRDSVRGGGSHHDRSNAR